MTCCIISYWPTPRFSEGYKKPGQPKPQQIVCIVRNIQVTSCTLLGEVIKVATHTFFYICGCDHKMGSSSSPLSLWLRHNLSLLPYFSHPQLIQPLDGNFRWCTHEPPCMSRMTCHWTSFVLTAISNLVTLPHLHRPSRKILSQYR